MALMAKARVSTSIAWLALPAASAIGCGGPSAAPQGPTRPVAEVPTSEAPAASTRATPFERAAPKHPPIAERHVGALRLGEPLPKSLLGGDLAALYRTTLYADAQPLEGFAFERPPLFATVHGGPYHDFGMASPGEPIPTGMPAEAASLARDGKLTVSMLVVTTPTLETSERIGVGDSFAEMQRAYPQHSVFTLPGLWEEPSCIAKPHEDSTIHFFFAKCAGRGAERFAADEPILRVVILDAGKN
jgi:hypothetical protein